jgi:acyl-CoA thioester hydrolase
MKIRVYYEDTDAGGIVYHSQYLNFCERARSEIFFDNNIFFDKQNYFVVKNLNADYISSAKLGDIIKVNTQITKIKNASLQLLQTITLDKNIIFSMSIILVFLSHEKIAKIPQKYLDIFSSLILHPLK